MSKNLALIEAFDQLAERMGYEEVKGIRARDKENAMIKLGRTQNVTLKRFRECVFVELQTAQRRAEKSAAGRWRHERRNQAKRLEKDFLASLGKPVSRIAGQREHLMVLANLPADLFFKTPEWRRTRWEALNLYGRRCVSCGAVPEDEARLTATHIQGRLVAPQRAFSLQNIRILCVDCHIGRRALDRPHGS